MKKGDECMPLEAMKILCVDDIKVNVVVLKHLLKAIGVADVRTAQSGEEALEKIADYAPDVVITDLSMPGMSGIELARKIASVQRVRPIRIIALTADTLAAGEASGIEIFEQVLEKPATIAKICQALCGSVENDLLRHPLIHD